MEYHKDNHLGQARQGSNANLGRGEQQGHMNPQDKQRDQFRDNQRDSQRDTQQDSRKDSAPQGYGYVLRKAEKLTTALYLVTDIMSDKEPMKWKAREGGVELLSDITVSSSGSPSEKMSVLRGAMKKVERIAAFLDIAQSTRMMSEMNASMLKKEYLALKDNIEAEWNRTSEGSKTILNEKFFEVARDPVPELSAPVARNEVPRHTPAVDVLYKGQPERTTTNQPSNHERREVPRIEERKVIQREAPSEMPSALANAIVRQVARTEVVEAPPRPMVFTPRVPEQFTPKETAGVIALGPTNTPVRRELRDVDMSTRARGEVPRDDRRTIILALIKQKPALTVKDIAKSIPGISEKTIQRELLSMVSEGTLMKKGERRWSTYSLNQF